MNRIITLILVLPLILLVSCATPEQETYQSPTNESIINPTVTLAATSKPIPEPVRVIDAFSEENYLHVAWSPDGSLLAVSAAAVIDETPIKVYDAETLELVYELTRDGMNSARFTTFSPNGRWMMASEISSSGIGGSVGFNAAIWDITTGERIEQVTNNATIWNAVWSPEGDRLAYWSSVSEPAIQFWAAPDPDEPVPDSLTLEGEMELGDAVWLPEDVIAFAGTTTQGRLGVWWSDAPDDPLVIQNSVIDYAPFISLSMDASLVAATDREGSMRVWDTKWGRLKYELQAKPNTRLSDLAHQFSSDSKFLAVGVSNEVVIWDMATGGIAARLHGHDSTVSFVAFSPDDQTLAVGEADGKVRLWYLPAHLIPPVTPTPIPSNTPAPTFDVQPVLAQTLQPVPPPTDSIVQLSALHWSDEQTLRATFALQPEYAQYESWLVDYDVLTGGVLETTRTPATPYRAFYSLDGSLYAAWIQGDEPGDIESSTVAVFDSATSDPIFTIPAEDIGAGNHIAWSPDSTRIAIQTFPRIEIYDAQTGEYLGSPDDVMRGEVPSGNDAPYPEAYGTVQWSPTGAWISSTFEGSAGAHAVIWDANTLEVVYELAEESDHPDTYEYGSIQWLEWSPDGHRALMQRSTRLEVYDIETGETQYIPFGDQHMVYRGLARWSPDGRYVALDAQIIVGGPLIVLVWDTVSNTSFTAYERSSEIEDISQSLLVWSPNRPWLATVDQSGLTIIDVSSQAVASIPLPFEGYPSQLSWSPQGRWLALGKYEGEIFVWDFTLEEK